MDGHGPVRTIFRRSPGDRQVAVAGIVVLVMLLASGLVVVSYAAKLGAGAETSRAGGPVAPGPVTVGSARAPGATPSVDPVYLGAMRQRLAFAGSDSAELYSMGGDTCAELDSGRDFGAVVGGGGGRGLEPEDVGYLVGVSVMAYCPRHKPMLEQLIGRSLPGI